MYLRVKEVAGRRYLYLVEGERRNGKVRQKTLTYLGPLTTLAYGIPDEARQKIQEDNPDRTFDWNRITEQIRKTPLRLDELLESRTKRYAKAIKAKSLTPPPRRTKATPETVFKQRTEGELTALAKLAAKGFRQTFQELEDGRYRMRP